MEGSASQSPRRCSSPKLGQRHFMVVLLSLGMAIVFITRVNLSVTLVAMVNSTDAELAEPEASGEDLHSVGDYDDCSIFATNRSQETDAVHPRVSPKANNKFQWSRKTQGLLLSSYYWGYAIPLIPVAAVVHRVNVKWLFAFGVMGPATLSLLIPLFASIGVYELMGLRTVQGIIESVTCPSIAVLLARWIPVGETSVLYIGAMMGALVGAIVGQLSAGVICDSVLLGGWPAVFYIQFGVCVLWLIPWTLTASNFPSENRWITEEEVNRIGVTDTQEQADTRSVPWRNILRDPAVWSFVLCMGVRDWLFNTNLACLPQFLSDVLALSAGETGTLSAIPYVSNLTFPMLFAFLSDFIMRKKYLSRTVTRKVFSFVGLTGTAICLISVTRVGCRMYPIIILMILGNSVISIVSGGFMPNAVDLSKNYCGVLFSMSNILSTAACILSPIIADTLADHGTLHEWGKVFDIGSGLAISSGLLFLLFSSGERRRWDVKADVSTENLQTERASLLGSLEESQVYGTI